MFELVRANKRRSVLLMFVMLSLLLILGFVIGFSVMPAPGFETVVNGTRYTVAIPPFGLIGMCIAFLIWVIQAVAAYFEGGRILMAASGAREIERADHPQLFNVVEEMSIAAGMAKLPRIYVIEDMGMNAFAAGRDPDNSCVAVTAGLLGQLNRDQLQGVVAHELSHIVNRDVLYMTMVGIMAGTIVMLSDIYARMMLYGGGRGMRYRSSDSKGGGGGQAIMVVIAVVLAILAPVIAQMIYFACSRRREYLADAGAAIYTRYPEGLASALEAISGNPLLEGSGNRVTAPMYIVSPLADGAAAFNSWTSTHPPIEERIRILREMAGGVSYHEYARAWSKVSGHRANIPASGLAQPQKPFARMPVAGLAAKPLESPPPVFIAAAAAAATQAPLAQVADTPVGIKLAKPRAGQKLTAEEAQQIQARTRQAGDLIRRLNGYRVIECSCGTKLKIPPNFKPDKVMCPRCRAIHSAADAVEIAAPEMAP